MPVGCRTYLGPVVPGTVRVGCSEVTRRHPTRISASRVRPFDRPELVWQAGAMSEMYEDVPEQTEQLDQDQLQPDVNLDNRGVDDALDEGYSPPENYSSAVRHGDRETLDERLAEEVPDEDYADDDEYGDSLDDGEVGDERAGRLMDPN